MQRHSHGSFGIDRKTGHMTDIADSFDMVDTIEQNTKPTSNSILANVTCIHTGKNGNTRKT